MILEAAARQERAKARLMNLAVIRQAILVVIALSALIGLLGQMDFVSVGLWE